MIHFILLYAVNGFTAPILFGPEFTFYVGITKVDVPTTEASMIAQLIRQDCSACYMHTDVLGNKYLFSASYNGKSFEFVISADPQVVEIQVEPMSFEDWEKIAPFFQKEIFDRIKKKHKPHAWQGAGHLNIGLSSFENVKHLKNFVFFFMNHPELSYVLGESRYDFLFARHILQTTQEFRDRMADVFKYHRIDPSKSDWENKIDFLYKVNEVYAERVRLDDLDQVPREFRGPVLTKKYNAMAFEQLFFPHRARIEIRTMRPQHSVDQWLLQQSLFKAIIEYTQKQAEVFNPDQNYSTKSIHHLERFKELLEKLGLNPENYSGLLKKSHQKQWKQLQSGVIQCLSLFN